MSAHTSSCCGSSKKKVDYIFWGGLFVVVFSYIPAFIEHPLLEVFTHSVREFFSVIWWGIIVGIFFVMLLDYVPRDFAMKLVGKPGTKKGIVQSALAGVFFDLCSHGILLVAMKLYERGASLGQVMAFLIASPWNSLSLTIILIALIGMKWTLLFIALSVVIALISGFLFDYLVERGVLARNPNRPDENYEPQSLTDIWQQIKNIENSIYVSFKKAVKESRVIIRWMLLGIILIALIRTFVELDLFQTLFAPTLTGLGLTILFATILEVCSEGGAPIATDLLNRAQAPGNSFTFLMAGVATDYTEIMGIKEATKSWKIALFLPLITMPQIIALGYVLNQY